MKIKIIDEVIQSFVRRIIFKLYFGSLRYIFRKILYYLFYNRQRIIFGPMKGLLFKGGPAEILGIYEMSVQDLIFDNLKPGEVFYDIGAGSGYFTILGAKIVGVKGYVYVFEPLPSNINEIQQTIRDNKFLNCFVIPKAISNISGIAKLYYYNDSKISSLFQSNRFSIYVSVTTLDEFIKQNHYPNLIKVDVEGAEVSVLNGASELLKSNLAPKWIIEVHSLENYLLVKKILSSYGYTLKSLTQKKNKLYPTHIFAFKESSFRLNG